MSADDVAAVADDHAGTVADRDYLMRALAALPKRQRTVLVLRYYSDLSELEIADVLGCSVGTVKSQASRGLARLRAVVERGTEAERTWRH
jgi:RNA polymerase sigma factor (sigma-70 family)